MKEYHLAFVVGGSMHFSVIKRILTFWLTWQLLTRLFLGCAEPEPCLSNVLEIVCPGNVTGFRTWKSNGRVASWPKSRK